MREIASRAMLSVTGLWDLDLSAKVPHWPKEDVPFQRPKYSLGRLTSHPKPNRSNLLLLVCTISK